MLIPYLIYSYPIVVLMVASPRSSLSATAGALPGEIKAMAMRLGWRMSRGIPRNGWFPMENPVSWGYLGTPISGNLHMRIG